MLNEFFSRRYNIDAIEKQTLQTALDNLQNNITIKNRTQLVERLEMITRRQLSLKFTENINTNSLFISSDMFYLEILLDSQSSFVSDVKVSQIILSLFRHLMKFPI
jgi:mediator of RNA polymerase II transcription subunit 1